MGAQPENQPEKRFSMDEILEAGRNASPETKELAQLVSVGIKEDPFLRAMMRLSHPQENISGSEIDDFALVQRVVRERDGDKISEENLKRLEDLSSSYDTAVVTEYMRLHFADHDGTCDERYVLLEMLLFNGSAGYDLTLVTLRRLEKHGTKCCERIDQALDELAEQRRVEGES